MSFIRFYSTFKNLNVHLNFKMNKSNTRTLHNILQNKLQYTCVATMSLFSCVRYLSKRRKFSGLECSFVCWQHFSDNNSLWIAFLSWNIARPGPMQVHVGTMLGQCRGDVGQISPPRSDMRFPSSICSAVCMRI